MKRKQYLNILMTLPIEWVEGSAKHPSPYMSKTHILLHYIALRARKAF